jgi:hypothetical protein
MRKTMGWKGQLVSPVMDPPGTKLLTLLETDEGSTKDNNRAVLKNHDTTKD